MRKCLYLHRPVFVYRHIPCAAPQLTLKNTDKKHVPYQYERREKYKHKTPKQISFFWF